MKRSEAIQFFGSISKLAKALDITYEAVRQWPEDGVPMLRQYQIMTLSDGKLKVDGSQSQIRTAS